MVFGSESHNRLVLVGLAEGHTDRRLAGKYHGFAYAVARKVAGVVDGEICCAGVTAETALQDLDFLIQGLDAEQGHACGVNG